MSNKERRNSGTTKANAVDRYIEHWNGTDLRNINEYLGELGRYILVNQVIGEWIPAVVPIPEIAKTVSEYYVAHPDWKLSEMGKNCDNQLFCRNGCFWIASPSLLIINPFAFPGYSNQGKLDWLVATLDTFCVDYEAVAKAYKEWDSCFKTTLLGRAYEWH